MIKAGLKGDPSAYYKVKKENIMTGEEIRRLVLGKTIKGKYWIGPWTIKMNEDGQSEAIWPTYAPKGVTVHKGKVWVEGDKLCQQYKTSHGGLKDCANIYKNPQGDRKTMSEYFLFTDYMSYLFSVEQ